jgi:carboxypeptidase D
VKRFTWDAGTLSPVQNPYSWTNLTNMLWIEQPVGVGFTQGVPNITNEVELGLQLIGFYKSFVDTFDTHGWDVYLTGESYGKFYDHSSIRRKKKLTHASWLLRSIYC